MTPEQFCYWLQGFIELQDADHRAQPPGLTEAQRTVIKDHLALVMQKVTPTVTVQKKSSKRELLQEEIDRAKGARGQTLEDLIDEMQKTQKTYCDPYNIPSGSGKRIC